MEKAVFLDKDGTLIYDVPYNTDPRRIRLYPDAAAALAALQGCGFRLVIVSNQSGVARGIFEERALDDVWSAIRDELVPAGVRIDGCYFCPHHPCGIVEKYSVDCDCRKPRPGMLLKAASELGISLKDSWMIGDILNDVEAGRRAGCRTILLDNGHETEWVPGEMRCPDYVARGLLDAAGKIVELETLNYATRLHRSY